MSFFGDQHFWGQRIVGLGVGKTIRFAALSAQKLCGAIKEVCENPDMSVQARRVQEQLSKEDGVENAISAFHHYLMAFERKAKR